MYDFFWPGLSTKDPNSAPIGGLICMFKQKKILFVFFCLKSSRNRDFNDILHLM